MRAVILACILLLGARAHAAFDVFLQVTPSSGTVAGEVADPLYAGWIQVLSFEIGTEATVTFSPPSASSGPARFRSFTLTKTLDAASGALFTRLVGGQVLAEVKMVVVQRSPSRVEMWDIRATTCLLERQEIVVATGDEQAQERITLQAVSYEWAFVSVTPSGDAAQEYFASLNLATNAATKGTRTPSFPGRADSDGDGMTDGWELFYGLDPQIPDATRDSDNDGLDNLHEFIAHTDPRQPQSILQVTSVQPAGPGSYQLRWESVAGLTYRIESASAPGGPWTVVQTVPASSTGTTTATVSAPPNRAFFRVKTP